MRNAEFGFFGAIVNTRVQVPEACGHFFNAGEFDCAVRRVRALRIS